MDLFPIFEEILKAVWWLVPLAVIVGLLKSPWVKGYFGALTLRLSARLFLDRDTYHPIHHVHCRRLTVQRRLTVRMAIGWTPIGSGID